jgi:hypothetical protein
MLPTIDSAILLQAKEGIVGALRESFDVFVGQAAAQAPRLLAALLLFAVFLVCLYRTMWPRSRRRDGHIRPVTGAG